jgi:hypothetical protein
MLWISVDYAKKKEKRAQIKFIRDETVQPPNGDIYKSHTVHAPTGEPPNSTSRPAAKRKAGVVRPITKGKLLRPGGPSSSANVRVSIVAVLMGCLQLSIAETQGSSKAKTHCSGVTWKVCSSTHRQVQCPDNHRFDSSCECERREQSAPSAPTTTGPGSPPRAR